MAMIGFWLPSFISMAIYRKRSGKISIGWQSMLARFGIYVLLNTWIVQALLTYLLGQGGITEDYFYECHLGSWRRTGEGGITESALTSFPFFTKYVVLASLVAVILPYAEEILRKCIGVSVSFNADDGKKENEEK